MSQPTEGNVSRIQSNPSKFKPGSRYGSSETAGSGKVVSGSERKYREKDRRSGHSGYSTSKQRPTSNDASSVLNPHTILLKSRIHETRSLSPVASSVSISTPQKSTVDMQSTSTKETPKGTPLVPPSPIKILNEELMFQDSFMDFLSDNADFLVVGCVGLQWSGKSTILSHLAASNCHETIKHTVFNVSAANYQLKGESSTVGLDAFITSERIIWLDCQPLLSAAVAERDLATFHSKDAYKESVSKMEMSSCIGTMVEVQSLQLLSFLYCICHVLLVVQDCLADPNLVRLLQTAEMLKPNLSSDESSVDHMPHLITLYNRGQPSDLVPEMIESALKFYRQAFAKSRLLISSQAFQQVGAGPAGLHESVNFAALLDWNLKNPDGAFWIAYEQTIPSLKKALLSLPRNPFGPPALTEKTWFSFANRAWDAVRKSSLMMEYARLLP